MFALRQSCPCAHDPPVSPAATMTTESAKDAMCAFRSIARPADQPASGSKPLTTSAESSEPDSQFVPRSRRRPSASTAVVVPNRRAASCALLSTPTAFPETTFKPALEIKVEIIRQLEHISRRRPRTRDRDSRCFQQRDIPPRPEDDWQWQIYVEPFLRVFGVIRADDSRSSWYPRQGWRGRQYLGRVCASLFGRPSASRSSTALPNRFDPDKPRALSERATRTSRFGPSPGTALRAFQARTASDMTSGTLAPQGLGCHEADNRSGASGTQEGSKVTECAS